jgi:hypothetical protein
LEELIKKNDQLIDDKLKTLSRLDLAESSEISALAKQKLDGPASRMEALSRITAKSDAIWWAH